MSARLEVTTPQLEAAEKAWWARYAEVEDRFCWVQTPPIQRALRGEYLSRIVQLAPPGGRILELGCGTGWLACLLARLGDRTIVGIDFSEAQIARARQQARNAGVGERVTFQVGDAAVVGKESGPFDVVVLHTFLHHLTTAEIRQVIATASQLLTGEGRLVVLEPVLYPAAPLPRRGRWLLRLLKWLYEVPDWGRGLGIWKMSPAEQATRTLIQERIVGTPPRGPSPKEMPFGPLELNDLLAPFFEIRHRRRCLAVSQLVAQETLLLELSHPRAACSVRRPLLWAARAIERRLLGLDPPPAGIWIFEMFEGVPLAASGAGAPAPGALTTTAR